MPDPITADELATLRRLAGEDRPDTTYTEEQLTAVSARWVCPATAALPERWDLYAAAAEVWEGKALALVPAPSVAGERVVQTERTGDVSVTYADRGSVTARDYWALARRMARRSCTYRLGARSVDLLPPDDRARLDRLDSYDAWYATALAERRGLGPQDGTTVINRAAVRD